MMNKQLIRKYIRIIIKIYIILAIFIFMLPTLYHHLLVNIEKLEIAHEVLKISIRERISLEYAAWEYEKEHWSGGIVRPTKQRKEEEVREQELLSKIICSENNNDTFSVTRDKKVWGCNYTPPTILRVIDNDDLVNFIDIEPKNKEEHKILLEKVATIPPLEETYFGTPQEVRDLVIAKPDFSDGELLIQPFINYNNIELTGLEWCKVNITEAEIIAWGCENWLRWSTWENLGVEK